MTRLLMIASDPGQRSAHEPNRRRMVKSPKQTVRGRGSESPAIFCLLRIIVSSGKTALVAMD